MKTNNLRKKRELTDRELRQRREAGISRHNDEGKDRALELSRAGLGMKEIMRQMPGVTKRRIRRWRTEAGLPTQVATVKDAANHGRNVFKRAGKLIVREYAAGFAIGDELTHWSNHPSVREHYDDPARLNRWQRDYYQKNKRRIWQRVKADPAQKLRRTLRTRMYCVLRGLKKSAPTMELIGCSREFLIQWIEHQWKPGMTWVNHGIHGWHIDHIIPCASFDLTSPAEQRKCFHYSNLRPLWAKENWSKRDKMPTHQPELSMPI